MRLALIIFLVLLLLFMIAATVCWSSEVILCDSCRNEVGAYYTLERSEGVPLYKHLCIECIKLIETGREKENEIDVERLADAIFKAEGGYKATWLYGIRSVKYEDEAEARRICLNSIRNNIVGWEKAGKPEDFIVFMGRRYCPPKAHPKNSNWVRNVKAIYEANKN